MSYKAVLMNDEGYVVRQVMLPEKRYSVVTVETCPNVSAYASEASASLIANKGYHEIEWYLVGDVPPRGSRPLFGIYLRGR